MNARLEHLVTGSLFAGLEIQFLTEGIGMHLIVLRRKGRNLLVEKSFTRIEDIAKISEHLAIDIPLAIAFTGKGILHRKIAVDPDSGSKILLSKILPNASLKDFYLQIFPGSRDEQFVSVLRKTVIDEMLEQLKQFSVVACSLGPLAVMRILPLLKESKNELQFGNHCIYLQNNQLEEIEYAEINHENFSFDLEGQQVESENLIAFACAFQHLLSEEQRILATVESLVVAKERFLQKKLIKTSGKFLLIFMLFVLAGNYFVFSHYWSAKAELENKLQSDGGAFSDVRKLEKQVQAKRLFLEQAGLLNPSNNSFYADQIAMDLPHEILLTRMELAPRLKLPEEDSIGFKPGLVEMEGSCSQSLVLNNWLQELKEKKWIKNVTLESYVQDKNMKEGEFEITLELE